MTRRPVSPTELERVVSPGPKGDDVLHLTQVPDVMHPYSQTFLPWKPDVMHPNSQTSLPWKPDVMHPNSQTSLPWKPDVMHPNSQMMSFSSFYVDILLALPSAVCSPLLVRYCAIEMTGLYK